MSKEAEKEVKISPKEVERVKKALAEIEALKKALGWEEEEGNVVPGSSLRAKRSNLVRLPGLLRHFVPRNDTRGASATAVALLIALAVAVF